MSHLVVNTSIEQGVIRPLHGVNNGPVGYGSLVDVSHRFKELAIPYTRLHDPNWPHPREVDIPQIFPDFNADPDDPASYKFGPTDDYLRRIASTGAKVVYRLGVSIEHTQTKYFTSPPADFQKWAKICIGIIKHYTEGWADGFDGGVDYWEIWNEPDTGPLMWSGTFEQYLDMYAIASKAFKTYNLDLKVGGFAAAYPNGECVPRFLEFCRKNQLPLDFFSWHTYAGNPSDFQQNVPNVRKLLDEYGFVNTESHLNEWNYVTSDWGPVFTPGYEFVRKEAFDRQKNEEGACFCAASLICFQNLPVNVANYYDGQPSALYCGLFDYYGVPQKTFYAFKAFRKMIDHPVRMDVSSDESDGLFALAGKNPETNQIAVLISNFGQGFGFHSIDIQGLAEGVSKDCRIYLVDHDHNLEMTEQRLVSEINNRIEFSLRRHSTLLILIS